jgi:predicted metal-dependent phosphoesterase TrpH
MYPTSCNADLHCHSTASDGRFTPTQLVAHAAHAGIELLALTDHDSINGVAEAQQAARSHQIAFVPGVEISVIWERKTLHIVGLNVDPNCPTLSAGLAELQMQRQVRAVRMAQHLEKLGVADALQRAEQSAQIGQAGATGSDSPSNKGGQVTRTHFARLLVEDGKVTDMKQAFKRYLGAGKPAYVGADWTSLEHCVAWIHAAGGLAVIAHPLRYQFTGAWRNRMLSAFKDIGGDGLEVSCGTSQQAHDITTSTQDALRYDFLASAGSDFHGPEQTWLRYGRLAPLSTQLRPIWTHLPQAHE